MTQAILIVGGGLGIGLSTTLTILSSTPSSTKLIVFGLSADSSLDAHADRLWICEGDVTSAADRARAVELCVEKAGGIDTLLYCAGVLGPIQRIEKVDLEAVRRSFEVNFFGTVAMCQEALPYIKRSGKGRIVILSSTCDFRVAYCGWMSYCVSKAALSRFIQLLAHEEKDVLVQGVYPRLTRTRMPADVIAGRYKGIMAKEEIEKFRAWSEKGDEIVEPPEWCGEAVAKLAIGQCKGGKSGEILYHDEHVPREKS